MKYKLFENDQYKCVRSEHYNYNFSKTNGQFVRYGKTTDDADDPPFSPIGPELVDWEISTICRRSNGKNCAFCYKTNSEEGVSLDFNTFKQAFDKLPRNVGQIAYGLGTINGCPSLFDILEYTREKGIIPNLTVAEATDEEAERLAKLCGAISVSHYSSNLCFDTVRKLTEASKLPGATLCATNIHQLFSSETYNQCVKLFDSVKTDERLNDLGAVVLLSLKPKGERNTFHSATYDQFKSLVILAQEKEISLGMDSCSAPMMLKVASELGQENVIPSIEPCESFGLFSAYINVNCDYFPCSFAEGEGEWKEGMSLLDCEDFVKDIWFSEKINKWRAISLGATDGCDCKVRKFCRICPIFDITPCFKNQKPKHIALPIVE